MPDRLIVLDALEIITHPPRAMHPVAEPWGHFDCGLHPCLLPELSLPQTSPPHCALVPTSSGQFYLCCIRVPLLASFSSRVPRHTISTYPIVYWSFNVLFGFFPWVVREAALRIPFRLIPRTAATTRRPLRPTTALLLASPELQKATLSKSALCLRLSRCYPDLPDIPHNILKGDSAEERGARVSLAGRGARETATDRADLDPISGEHITAFFGLKYDDRGPVDICDPDHHCQVHACRCRRYANRHFFTPATDHTMDPADLMQNQGSPCGVLKEGRLVRCLS